MNTFEPGPHHKFAFGLRPIGHSHRERFGKVPPAPIEPWEFVYRLGDLNVWGVGFHDDDLVPRGASPSERHDILDKFSKALDSTGIVVSIARTNLSGQPVFDRGAFTSMDRDVRRYAIQKAMRAIDLGVELGAQLHGLSSDGEGAESVAAKPPLDALDRYREAVDFLCGYVREQRYPTRFALQSMQHERSDDSLFSTVGHALAFIDTLEHSDMVGLDPVIVAGAGRCHGVAQAIDARKLVHIELNTQSAGLDGQEPTFGAASVCDAFFLVKLIEESGFDGPLHFDVDRSCFDDSDGVWDVAAGCMRTYRALVAKARRFDDDPDIRDALAECCVLELAEPSVGPFTVDAGRALSSERFDPQRMAERRPSNQRLDQLVIDLVLGLR